MITTITNISIYDLIMTNPFIPVILLSLVIFGLICVVAKRDAKLTKDFEEHNKPLTKDENNGTK